MTLTRKAWIRRIIFFTALAILGFIIGAGRTVYAAIYAVEFGEWFKCVSLACLSMGGAGMVLVSGAKMKD